MALAGRYSDSFYMSSQIADSFVVFQDDVTGRMQFPDIPLFLNR